MVANMVRAKLDADRIPAEVQSISRRIESAGGRCWLVGGTVRDAGPFDIVQVIDAAGQAHHCELILRRVTGG